jgi:UDPglucose 6-dehydrogenase
MEIRPTEQPGSDSRKIAVIGLGHVGLPTAVGLSSLGWNVIGADEDPAKIEQILSGKSPFFEPGLDDLLKESLARGNFCAVSQVTDAIRSASVIFICVGTPQREDGTADLTQVEAIARTIGRNLNGYKLVVEKSTVPAITAAWIKRTITRYALMKRQEAETNGNGKQRDKETDFLAPDFDVASNPEFLQEGKAIDDFFRPYRLVIGTDSSRARTILKQIYKGVQSPVVTCDVTTAELIKHAANAFLSTKISFINMVTDICDSVGADVTRVAEGLGLDPRIAPAFLQAGIGFGGYCFPKDLSAFAHLAEQHGVDASLLRAVEGINLQRTEVFMKKVRSAMWQLRGKTLGILGLAFKPNTDDIREAPSLRIISALLKEGAALRVHDPRAIPAVKAAFPSGEGEITFCDSPYDAARGTEALLLLTEWGDYRSLDLARLRDSMQDPVIIDGRNFFDPLEMQKAGFSYVGMGRRCGEVGYKRTTDAFQVSPAAIQPANLEVNLHA